MWQEIQTGIIANSREGRAELGRVQDLVSAIDCEGGECLARAMPGTGRVIVTVFGPGAILRDVVTALDRAGYLD